MDDWELLRRFAQQGSQPAFAELVGRHLNFVYSSARRQVRSPQLAEDVSQAVFLELARQAATLRPGTPLTSWLYLVTRRVALNALRAELRRQAREHVAYELSAMNPAPSVWEKLEPLLDEALETLDPHDRSALFLRYFENKPLREVGAALGASEDAAQKRVSRALEHLRRFFTRHGVTVSAAGLATHLSAHAVEVAPTALASIISTATTSSLATATPVLAAETTRALAMTTLQKTLLAGAIVAIGAGVYEIRALAVQREELTALEQDVAALTARERAAHQKSEATRGRVAAAQNEAARIAAVPPAPVGDPAIAELVSRAERLKQSFVADAALKIPEMALLKDGDWLDIARERPLDSEAERRASLARVRGVAKGRFTSPMFRALSAYVAANEGRLPLTARDLQPFIALPEPVETAALEAMLARYEIKAQGSITQVPDRALLIAERELAVIDRDYDTQVRVSRLVSARDTDPFKINFSSDTVSGPLAPAPSRYLR